MFHGANYAKSSCKWCNPQRVHLHRLTNIYFFTDPLGNNLIKWSERSIYGWIIRTQDFWVNVSSNMSPGNNLLSKAHWKYNTYVVNNVCGKVFWPEHSALLRQVQFKFLQVVIGKKWDITLLFAMIMSDSASFVLHLCILCLCICAACKCSGSVSWSVEGVARFSRVFLPNQSTLG